jgi:hypothetical protein
MALTALIAGMYVGLLAGICVGALIVWAWRVEDAAPAPVAPRLRQYVEPCMN